jgi:hypothetical protein
MTPLMPISSPEEEGPRRRKRVRRWPGALGEDQRRALVETLTERTLPTFDFFLFILLAALLACVGFGLHSTTLLVAAALVAPLLAPVCGISFGLAAAFPRYVGRNLLGVLLGVALAFLLAALLGFAYHLVFSGTGVSPAESPDFLWVDLPVAFLASLWMANRLAREPGGARLPSAALAYVVLIPIMAGGWNWVMVGPSASLSLLLRAVAGLCLAVLAGMGMFLLLGIRPFPGTFGASAVALGAVVTFGLFFIALAGLSPRGPEGLVGVATPTPLISAPLPATPTDTPTPTPLLTATSSPSPTAGSTPTPQATPTLAAVRGVILGTKGKGVLLRDAPGGTTVSSLIEGTMVEAIGAPEAAGGMEWVLVRDGQGHQGWLALQYFATLTPTPVS